MSSLIPSRRVDLQCAVRYPQPTQLTRRHARQETRAVLLPLLQNLLLVRLIPEVHILQRISIGDCPVQDPSRMICEVPPYIREMNGRLDTDSFEFSGISDSRVEQDIWGVQGAC